MGRIVDAPATRGSRYWLLRCIEECPDLLQPPAVGPLDWVAPRLADEGAEYRDAAFLAKLGLDRLAGPLAAFWPQRGPVWDGLATAGDKVFLVEAKSHVAEFLTTPSAAKAPKSVGLIAQSLSDAKAALQADDRSDWSRTFFQYANRLAHLWWLRQNRVDAQLLFVSFLSDDDMKGPKRAETWSAVFNAADHALGLNTAHALSPYIYHVHPDVRTLNHTDDRP